ncbi:hypothetical protein GQX74_005894 [Glossina fuscipes]|nr:hypothetical protein GQX74_005894 [Glossina fuscipes]
MAFEHHNERFKENFMIKNMSDMAQCPTLVGLELWVCDSKFLLKPSNINVERSARKNIRKACIRHAVTYNLRPRAETYHVGQTVFTRNFIQSSLADNYNSKIYIL